MTDDEKEYAIVLANHILNGPEADVDDELAVLSRQLLLETKRADMERDSHETWEHRCMEAVAKLAKARDALFLIQSATNNSYAYQQARAGLEATK